MSLQRIFTFYVIACALFVALGAMAVSWMFAAIIVVQAGVQIIPAVLMARYF